MSPTPSLPQLLARASTAASAVPSQQNKPLSSTQIAIMAAFLGVFVLAIIGGCIKWCCIGYLGAKGIDAAHDIADSRRRPIEMQPQPTYAQPQQVVYAQQPGYEPSYAPSKGAY